jgi:glycosyltransferase involved in cell wall biosynthesis
MCDEMTAFRKAQLPLDRAGWPTATVRRTASVGSSPTPRTDNDSKSRRSSAEGLSISFVIPALDEGLYVGATLSAIRRALGEHPRPVEIVVVDGGSNDRTVAEARELADRVIADAPAARLNIAAGRNIGAKQSRGDLLFHTDADVRFEDLPRLLQAIDTAFADSRLVAATMSLWPYPWDARKLDVRMHTFGNAVIRASLSLGVRLARGECLVIRRETFEALQGFNERLALGEDCDLFRRASKRGRVAFLKGHRVYHSPRRFRQWGYLRVFLIFTREGLWQWMFRRPYLRQWTPVR